MSLIISMMRPTSDFVVLFAVGELDLALNLAAVERVIRAVDISPLPDTPRGVLGVINMQGRLVPVLGMRARFGLPAREVRAADYLIIARLRSRVVALLADTVAGVVPASQSQIIQSSEILPEMECFPGVIKLQGNLIFLHDLEKFLSNEDYDALQLALIR